MIRGVRILFLKSMLLGVVCITSLRAQPPVNNVFDPVIIHNLRGVNPFYEAKDQLRFTFELLPFYQHAAGSKPGCGKTFMCCPQASSDVSDQALANCCPPSCKPSCRHKKVPEGDRTGRWNMIGLLQGTQAAPGGMISEACQPTLHAAESTITNFSFCDGAVPFDSTFTDTTESFGHYSVPINYQKIGLRGRMRLALVAGFGLAAKGGVVRYKQIPCFEDKSCDAVNIKNCMGDLECPDVSVFTCEQIQQVQKLMMHRDKREAIFREICLDADCYCRTAFEDTHVQFDWSGNFDMYDQDNILQVKVQPYAAVGFWAPTGEEHHPDFGLRIPTTNDGFWGVTVEGGLNFSFPGTIVLGFGGGATFYESRVLHAERVPSSRTQSVIYPWKTDIKREPGTSWNAHIDFASYNFIDNFSFFFNYVYTKHEQDRVYVLCKNCTEPDENGQSQQLFFPEKLEEESEWDSQMAYFALEYEITDQLFMGVGVQLPIAGRRIYKISTIMGSIRFHF